MSAPAENFVPPFRALFASGAEGQFAGRFDDGGLWLGYSGPDPFTNDADAEVFAVVVAEHVRDARRIRYVDSFTLACTFSDEDGTDDEDGEVTQ